MQEQVELWQWVLGEVDESQCPWVAESRAVVEARVAETEANGFNWEWLGLANWN